MYMLRINKLAVAALSGLSLLSYANHSYAAPQDDSGSSRYYNNNSRILLPNVRKQKCSSVLVSLWLKRSSRVRVWKFFLCRKKKNLLR